MMISLTPRLLVPRSIAVCTLALALWSGPSSAQIVQTFSFNPDDIGGICGLAASSDAATVWIYPCFGTQVFSFSEAGEPVGSFPSAGEASNDVDVAFVPVSFTLAGTTVPAGSLLFINGETGPAEIYAVDPATGDVLDTLATTFGVSHVVGGTYHPGRGTIFLVQDNVPGPANRNRLAEMDPATGDTLRTMFIGDSFSVSYGDLDVSGATGNLFVVSSAEASIAEFTPDGALVQEHALPEGVGSLSGIALDCEANEAWVSNTSGLVFRLGGVSCGGTTSAEGEASPGVGHATVYPNPMRTHAAVALAVEQTQRVRIAVHDVLGREVAVLHEGPLARGEHAFRLDAVTLPAGTYLVRVTGPGRETTVPVTVLR